MGYEGSEAIVVARTRSYINPNTNRWNAPGLGNTEASITRDQRRRTNAVASALAAYSQEQPHLKAGAWAIGAVADTPPPEPIATAPEPAEPADIIFQPWTDGSEPTPTPVAAEESSVQATSQPGRNTLATVVDRVLGLTVPSPGADSPALDPVVDPVLDPVSTVTEELPGASQTAVEESGTEQPAQPEITTSPRPADHSASTTWAEVREASQTPPLVEPSSDPEEPREIPDPTQVSPPLETENPPAIDPGAAVERPAMEPGKSDPVAAELPEVDADGAISEVTELPATDPGVADSKVTELPEVDLDAIATPTPVLSPSTAQPSEAPLGLLTPEEQGDDDYSAAGLDQMPGATPDTVLHFPSAHAVREAHFSLDELNPFTND
jgi:hypothetical protein